MINVKAKKNKIPIVASSNNDFAIMAAALLKSIELNCLNPNAYIIYLLSDGITNKNKVRIQKSSKLDVEIIDIGHEILNEIELPKKPSYLPRTSYFRLMIPEIFKEFNKVIYLDVDTLVLKDLGVLWQIDMEDNLALACQCFYEANHVGSDYYELAGIPRDAPYFNAGIMVIDIQKWKSENIRDKTVKLLDGKLSQYLRAMDEEALNIILFNKWKAIDQRWNYPPNVATEDDPAFILHFIGYKPIYQDYQGNHQDFFYRILNQTNYSKVKPYNKFMKAYIKLPLLIKNKILKLFKN